MGLSLCVAVEIVSNCLGGHSVPEGMTAAPDDIVNKQTPAHVQAKEDGAISPELTDVFCEKGVVKYDDTRRILEAG
uniref:Uncharacterized protein n=1 Tax=Phytophthora fragariae TaxID=53985 RepID=A0A6A3EVU8_9STRA|nr:hypothetical protein PF009_g13575 [Phytophthora fragariae]